ncbi:hypothetical protein BWQ96_00223 [Gracilariopsis chorda]|uniref:holo-[acyl-carrier-protein] synthase n=1 Tax=Gracilariopsis chorda TaxID=448386 RepID=A0A2V3J6Y1_9FLOR|nr:hypothetical protein BWQ96_00223 [Gracilariopsis chorda]|eukprot:PXF50063.1 hypothetical protein BWQ96_00223 [Gracilariopsis chorda]
MKASGWIPSTEVSVALVRKRIDVWKTNLCDISLKQLSATVLSEDEERRASQAKYKASGERFRACRACVRDVLARYLHNVHAHEIEFRRGEHGKLLLRDNDELSFNVSHSGNMGLIAVTTGMDIGVDVETAGRTIGRMHALARRSFGDGEMRQLEAAGSDEKMRTFLQLWTRKEAFVKCTGEGIQRGLRSFEVDVRSGTVLVADDTAQPKCEWTVRDVSVDDRHIGALCYSYSTVHGSAVAPHLRHLQWRAT